MFKGFFNSGIVIRYLVFALASASLFAQDISRLGGDLTSDLPGIAAVQVNAPNITDPERKNLQLTGFGVFHGNFLKSQGLGPLFINDSCGGCHVGNGKGPIRLTQSLITGSTMVVKVSLPGLNPVTAAPRDVPGIGEQFADHAAVPSRNKALLAIKWANVPVKSLTNKKKTEYVVRKPVLTYSFRDARGRKTSKIVDPSGKERDTRLMKLATSIRMTPTVIGVGLLEAISEETIFSMSDPYDLNKDGVKGHPNYVPDLINGGQKIGRFGFKGSHPTVEQQTAAAFVNDMGLTNFLFKNGGVTTEISDDAMTRITLYQKLAGVPFARSQDNPRVANGKYLFQSIGCATCHRMTITTASDAADPELRNQVIHPFTDLLLHNMGEGLADKRAEYYAKGSDWRTTPLWGLGYRLSSGVKNFLHDGRARNLTEAILWHNGEGENSQIKFRKLTAAQKTDLLLFLGSL